MRKHFLIYLLAVVVLAVWAPFACASGTAVASEALVVGDTAVGFTASNLHQAAGTFINQDCTAALIVVETNSIRVTEDGTTPAQGYPGVGYLLPSGSRKFIQGVTNIRNFKAIAATNGQGAMIEAIYYYGGEMLTP